MLPALMASLNAIAASWAEFMTIRQFYLPRAEWVRDGAVETAVAGAG
jgi:hypothetical protein